MRSLKWKGATVAIIVMASGAAAGQKQRGPIPAILITPVPTEAPSMPMAFNHTAVVDRILSFDANGDDRIARHELPERMEGLVGRGDKNHDGFLTADEVFALIDTRPPARQIQRFAVRAASLAEIIADLKLPPPTHDRAMATMKEHTVSGIISDPASDELYPAMRELLDDEDYENFVAAATRLRSTPPVFRREIACGLVSPPASRLH